MLPSAITRCPQEFATVNTDICYFKKQIQLYVVGQLLLADTHCYVTNGFHWSKHKAAKLLQNYWV